MIQPVPVQVEFGAVTLQADLALPENPRGAVLFAHGSGSSRLSGRNRRVAGHLQEAGFATLLTDLLTEQEEKEDQFRGHIRFNIALLAERVSGATEWLSRHATTRDLLLGYF